MELCWCGYWFRVLFGGEVVVVRRIQGLVMLHRYNVNKELDRLEGEVMNMKTEQVAPAPGAMI